MSDRHTHTDERRTGLVLAIVIFLLTAGGVGMALAARSRWWLPPVASVHGVEVDRLFYSTLVITGAVFVLVHVIMAVFVWRFGAYGEGRALHWPDHRPLELTYTIIPAIALAVMVSMGAVVWARVHSAPPHDALTVDVRGEQFAWLARYPGPDGVLGRIDPKGIGRDNPMGLDPADRSAADDITSREIHLVVNQPVRVRVRARDVLHSLFLAEFRVKQDAVPGMTVEIWFTPTREGEYELACAELCGVGHYIMKGKVKVESQQAFDAWLAQQKPALKPQ